MHLLGGKARSGAVFKGGTAIAAATATNTANVGNSGTGTHSGLSIGAEHTARRIAVGVIANRLGSAVTITGVTCDGVAMAELSNAAPGNGSAAIYEIPQNLLPDPTVTTADFVISTTGSPTKFSISVFRILSYAVGLGGSVATTGTGSPKSMTASAFALPANGCAVAAFSNSAHGGDGMSQADVTFLDHLTDADDLNFWASGGGQGGIGAMADFSAAVPTFDQRLTVNATGSPQHHALAVGGWGPY